MFPLLFLLRVTYCYYTENVFTEYTGVSLNSNYDVPYHKTSLLKCAAQCVTQLDQCTGFRYEEQTMLCNLHNGYCIGGYGNHSFHSSSIRNISMSTSLARGRPSIMSSQHSDHLPLDYLASKGNDGIIPGSGGEGNEHWYIFHTTEELYPWWRVDMELERCVWAVWFMNRGFSGFSALRAKNLMITVSVLESEIMDSGDNRCGYVETPEILNNTVICQQPLVGRYVQIQSRSTTFLHLYEVEVHGF